MRRWHEMSTKVRVLLQAGVRHDGSRASSLVTSAGVGRQTLKMSNMQSGCLYNSHGADY